MKKNTVEKIKAAKDYVKAWMERSAAGKVNRKDRRDAWTLSEAKNDAANIYAETEDEYNAIWSALKSI